MPAPRIRADRPLSNAERQARRAARHRVWRTALIRIRNQAASLDEARLIAAAALEIEQGEGGDWGQDLLREIRARAAE